MQELESLHCEVILVHVQALFLHALGSWRLQITKIVLLTGVHREITSKLPAFSCDTKHPIIPIRQSSGRAVSFQRGYILKILQENPMD